MTGLISKILLTPAKYLLNTIISLYVDNLNLTLIQIASVWNTVIVDVAYTTLFTCVST